VPPQPHGATCVRVYVQARSRGYSSNSSHPFPPHRLCAPAPPGVLHHDAESPDPTVELVTTDPLETVRDLKAEDGPDIGIVGSGTLAHALLPQIDQPSLKQHSAVIGVRNSGVQRPVQPADVPANRDAAARSRGTRAHLRPGLRLSRARGRPQQPAGFAKQEREPGLPIPYFEPEAAPPDHRHNRPPQPTTWHQRIELITSRCCAATGSAGACRAGSR
jgi:hypothetical protein